jgi:hypothetical protein
MQPSLAKVPIEGEYRTTSDGRLGLSGGEA